MNVLTLTKVYGETNTTAVNTLETNGIGGKLSLVWDAIDDGEVYPWNITANLPKIKPRVCVPAETRDVKVRC